MRLRRHHAQPAGVVECPLDRRAGASRSVRDLPVRRFVVAVSDEAVERDEDISSLPCEVVGVELPEDPVLEVESVSHGGFPPPSRAHDPRPESGLPNRPGLCDGLGCQLSLIARKSFDRPPSWGLSAFWRSFPGCEVFAFAHRAVTAQRGFVDFSVRLSVATLTGCCVFAAVVGVVVRAMFG